MQKYNCSIFFAYFWFYLHKIINLLPELPLVVVLQLILLMQSELLLIIQNLQILLALKELHKQSIRLFQFLLFQQLQEQQQKLQLTMSLLMIKITERLFVLIHMIFQLLQSLIQI